MVIRGPSPMKARNTKRNVEPGPFPSSRDEIRRKLVSHGLSAREAGRVLTDVLEILQRKRPVDYLGHPLTEPPTKAKAGRALADALGSVSRARRDLRAYQRVGDSLATPADQLIISRALSALDELSKGLDASLNHRILGAHRGSPRKSGENRKRLGQAGRPPNSLLNGQILDLKSLLKHHRSHCKLVADFLDIDESRVWKTAGRS